MQGVGYRFFAIRAARRIGVSGVVRNLPSGDVEVVAEGEEAQVDEFKRELERGPSTARVRSIEEETLRYSGRFDGFDVSF